MVLAQSINSAQAAVNDDIKPEDRRWALVLGVAEYQNENIPALDNSVNDSRTIAASLNNMGFQVYYLENAKKSEIEAVVSKIEKEQSGSELGMFYFAGHGLQVGGINYALPSDIDPTVPSFLQNGGVSINGLVSRLNEIGTKSLVVILDSCRNSPFPDEDAIGTGLALVDAPPNTIVAFSTAPGAVALDGASGNSPYTAALATALEGPEQDIRDVLRLVRARVRLATGGAQTPWYIDNTRTEVIIRPKFSVPAGELREMLSGRVISLPTTAWLTIADSADPRDFEQFAALFPNDQLSNAARRQLVLVSGDGLPSFPLMDLRVDGPGADIPGGLVSLITACDILATGIGDPMALVEPVPHDLVNTRAALRACVQAVRADPLNSRLINNLARVLRLDNRFDEALHYYKRAAELGNATAYAGIAAMYRQGLGVEPDKTQAFEAVRQGALLGSPQLRLIAGVYYREGWGTQQSFPEARRWMKLAAEGGYAPAYVAYGGTYRKGLGVSQDPRKALEYYRKAATLGSSDAGNLIGRAYLYGRGVKKNEQLGIRWLVRSSEEGNPYAAFALGRAFMNGDGVEKDDTKALAYFRLSAQRNFLGAYNYIGDVLRRESAGRAANGAEAYANYIIARKAAMFRDTRDSQNQLKDADERIAAILQVLSPAQAAEGERLADDWIEQFGLLDFNMVNE